MSIFERKTGPVGPKSKYDFCIFPDLGYNINLTSQPFKPSKPSKSFDGGNFGGWMIIGMVYVFQPMGFALEQIYDREVSNLEMKILQ